MNDDDVGWVREGVDGATVDINVEEVDGHKHDHLSNMDKVRISLSYLAISTCHIQSDSTITTSYKAYTISVRDSGGTETKVHIDFDCKWKPIKENAIKFSGQLGIIARDSQKVPLTYVSWVEMLDHIIDDIWKEVMDITDVPDAYKFHCLKVIDNRWRDWKCRWVDEQRLFFTSLQVTTDPWKTLKREKIDRLSMFIKTQTRKTKNDDEDLFDEESGDIVNQFNECLEEREDHEQDEDYREEVFTRVMGHDAHGRICMYEIGTTPSQVFGQSLRSFDINEDSIREEVERQYKTQIDNLKSKHESEIRDLQSKYNEVSSKLHLVVTHIGLQVNTSASESGHVYYILIFNNNRATVVAVHLGVVENRKRKEQYVSLESRETEQLAL
ncbi:hypothetical protein DVH24_005569 [Malus domestica]|uniref:Uncharacterized protein n=1 Tax=Malus domestica TaxID=3750 RepID=A0A498IIY7_MALDO|nr:hypothetical protein DVH24_005569 [Malus domestica]